VNDYTPLERDLHRVIEVGQPAPLRAARFDLPGYPATMIGAALRSVESAQRDLDATRAGDTSRPWIAKRLNRARVELARTYRTYA
jgi:hypothetical protein